MGPGKESFEMRHPSLHGQEFKQRAVALLTQMA